MELQDFIDKNPNYIEIFREKRLHTRKYSKYGLLLVKTYYNNEYDYANHKWMRYCRGAIINTETNRLVCIPPVKSDKLVNIDLDEYDDTYTYEPLIDGTMINMFYHRNEWMISTRSNIGAKNKWDGKVAFHKLFTSVNGDEWFNELNRSYSYSFTLQHKDNRIITPVYTNMIFINEVYDLRWGDINKVLRGDIPEIEGIYNIDRIHKEDLTLYLDRENEFSIKGFTIKKGCERIKWINPNYEYVEGLRENYNNKLYNYLELRKKWKLNEYLKYYPEERYIYDRYRDNYSILKDNIYNSYVSMNIRKEIEIKDIRYELRPIIKELHKNYQKNNEKVNMKCITDYLQNMSSKRFIFIYNRMFSS